MTFGTRSLLLILLIIMMPLILLLYQEVEQNAYFMQHRVESAESPLLEGVDNAESPFLGVFVKDPVMNLLGKSFDEIKQELGEPDKEGYSRWLGPHYYILYEQEKGVVRFCSPEPVENGIAVSIILGPGQEILGAEVGMLFSEIKEILGEPAYGPELGMDNLYYMDYFFGEMSDQVPEVFISFSAACIDCPTQDVFIKWEAFEYRPGGTIAGGDITKR